MRVLIVEDDNRVANALAAFLGQEGYTSVRKPDGHGALEALESDFDVVLLDLGLPDVDGFDLCSRIRNRTRAPIIITTARANVSDRIEGLRVGADDYLVKPYDVRELVARIAAVTRRERDSLTWLQDRPTGLQVGQVRIDLAARRVESACEPVALTPKEYEIVALLARYPGATLSRERIVREVWQTNMRGLGRSLEVHIASIRQKIGSSELIETVRGVGYRLVGG